VKKGEGRRGFGGRGYGFTKGEGKEYDEGDNVDQENGESSSSSTDNGNGLALVVPGHTTERIKEMARKFATEQSTLLASSNFSSSSSLPQPTSGNSMETLEINEYPKV